MRKKLLTSTVLLLLVALAVGLGGCERAKPAPPTATSEMGRQAATGTPVVTAEPSPEAPPGESATPPTPPEETPTSAPAQPTAAPSPPPPPVTTEGIEYVVRWGDTVDLIAGRYGVSVQDIVAANNLTDPNLIRAGDVLIIPGGAATPAEPAVHIVRRGETLQSIARLYGTTVDAIAGANGIANPNHIYVGQSLTIPGAGVAQSGGQTYVVQRGDTVSSIAVSFGTTAWAIAYANNLPNVNFIYVGQTLHIP